VIETRHDLGGRIKGRTYFRGTANQDILIGPLASG
jgi:hypothetical protein